MNKSFASVIRQCMSLCRYVNESTHVPTPIINRKASLHPEHWRKTPAHPISSKQVIRRAMVICFARKILSVSSSAGVRSRLSWRYLSFSFAGPRKLDDIIKKDLVEEKTGPEVAELWKSYHKDKVRLWVLIPNVSSRLESFVDELFASHAAMFWFLCVYRIP